MDSTYWDSIPTWSEIDKRFEVMADDLSGRIPVTRIDHWQDLSAILESDFFNRSGMQWIFRGHRRYDWSLLPTLGRLTENGIVSDELANKQLELFKRAVRGRLKDTSLLVEDGQDDELWSVGQHHGLMTPLLDWTYSPYVALFFAFAKEDQGGEDENSYRSIYVLNKTFVADNGSGSDIRILEPRKDDHGRLVNQAGLFTFSPTDATIENKLIEIISEDEEFKTAGEETEAEFLAQYICKIYIANEDREGCLKSLRRMNVHHASLFPDLLGASDYCNILMEEEQRQKAIAEGERQAAQRDKEIGSEPLTAQPMLTGTPVVVLQKETDNLVALLQGPAESAQVEPGRIQLIANQLATELKKHKVIDWETREAVQARIRNAARIILRKSGYPAAARDQVVENILKATTGREERAEDVEL